jgi:hypothetical protein
VTAGDREAVVRALLARGLDPTTTPEGVELLVPALDGPTLAALGTMAPPGAITIEQPPMTDVFRAILERGEAA